MKKVVSILTSVIILVLCFQMSAVAAVPPTVVPMWDNTANVTGTMVFDGTDGTAGMRVTGKPGTNRIESSCVIYKHVGSDWEYVTSDSKTVTTMSCYLEISFDGELGYEYKAEFSFVVYKGGVCEPIDRTIVKVCQ